MRLVIVSDFDLKGSGYQTIAAGLATAFSELGHEPIVVGLDYRGDAHDYPFAVISADSRRVGRIAIEASRASKAALLIVALDLTAHERTITLSQPGMPPYYGVFAVEAPPLLVPSKWATAIRRMAKAYAIAEFGAEEGRRVGLPIDHLRCGLDPFWCPPEPELRDAARQALGLRDRWVVLTVADNHERKNIPAAAEAMRLLRESHPEAYWILVTKERPSQIGWDVWALLRQHGLQRNAMVLDQGVARPKLRDLYGLADAFLLTSKAEGLCYPVLEAMACGTVPVASAVCELPLLLEGRGLTIEPEYWFTDPFGNTRRAFVSAAHAASQLARLIDEPGLRATLRAAGLEYAQTRRWASAAETILRDLHESQVQSQVGAGAAEAIAGTIVGPTFTSGGPEG